MFKSRKASGIFAVFILCVSVLGGCGRQASLKTGQGASVIREGRQADVSNELSYTGTMELQFAKGFAVDYYEDGYALVLTEDGRRYLVVPQDGTVPADLDEDVTVLKRPLDHIYLVATAVMDMFCELDGLDSVRFSGQEPEGWSRREVQDAMEQGDMLYAGRYDSPDYELIVSGGCSLAIENNMIFHCPEAAEKLESFGIPVFIDSSSYEGHPLGRAEWIKLYGVLLGKEKEAGEAFDKQVQSLKRVAGEEASGKTVAFFYITANGMASVRTPSDYIPSMIRLAGGKYALDGLKGGESRRSTVTMQMEEFYLAAKDADYLIYNCAIDKEPESMDDLVQAEKLLEDFKAVQQGHVWCTARDLYQRPMTAGQMIEDIHNMLSGEPDRQEETKYLYQLK